ncbi:ATP-binding cassette domain-containing protein [Poritiphilus flavus]|uniref:ATP-binding cassette domain-containing protein n=1 Tax=Poritiphilus flavus TaxID=2697053 RepID=A0A6L9E8Z3_9FLAO|nr:ATP-binding cassette domain-containing protein [Poritiphilus flavus]NAS11083.1 ATP-binding cassette domain-containing protein [Poritiphilus flavus]
MISIPHWVILINNRSDRSFFISGLLKGELEEFELLRDKKGALFSKSRLDAFMEEEIRHDQKILTAHTDQSLQSMSSGERKKVLLRHILESDPDYLILDNPFDNLDRDSQQKLKETLSKVSENVVTVLLLSRTSDILPFCNRFCHLNGKSLAFFKDQSAWNLKEAKEPFHGNIPLPLEEIEYRDELLVRFKDVSVSYGPKPILNNINWEIRSGDYWQLSGPNGSGKTTLLSMITGDNPKAYGQDLFLFGHQKGSGESVWDLKRFLGYFTPAMVDRFRGYHSLENMLISGLMDSIGLYVTPNEAQKRLAGEWLSLLGFDGKEGQYFHELSTGQQRLIMCARAMIKHPLLLILDEPTASLDDESARLVTSLVNKISEESRTAIVFVSHRTEPGLKPESKLDLLPTSKGSEGIRK